MHSLYAMAVAARSFGHSQSRYPYADTCDTAACQVYGGWASRPTPTGARTVREHPNTNAAVARTWGVVRRWPDGRMVSTEYSATHGPRSAGGQFPPVDDWFSNVPKNPLYTWVRTLDAATLETAYGLGDLIGAYSERDPASPYDGNLGQPGRPPGNRRHGGRAGAGVPQLVGLPVARAGRRRFELERLSQVAVAWSAPTIHGVPKRSVTIPHAGEKNVSIIAWVTVPPSARASKTRLASSTSGVE